MALGKLNTEYLKALDYRSAQKILARAEKLLSKIKFDAIAYTGASGSLIAPALAFRMNRGLILVRKEKNTHSGSKVEGHIDVERYIIVDDFVTSGKTVKRIAREVKAHCYQAKLVGVYEYHYRCKLIGKLNTAKSAHWHIEDVFKKYGVANE